MTTSEMFDRGLANRSTVLGEEYVTRSLREASDFGKPLQEIVTEYCWGAVWDRPGLSFKMRSLLNIAMLTALNRQHELATHVRGAITNGCTVEEIRETLIQAAIYCGVPAGIEATRTAEDVLKSIADVAGQSGPVEEHPDE